MGVAPGGHKAAHILRVLSRREELNSKSGDGRYCSYTAIENSSYILHSMLSRYNTLHMLAILAVNTNISGTF